MGMFTEQYKRLQEIKSQGFDPTKELYGERMKGLVSETSMTIDKVVSLVDELRKFDKEATGASESYYVRKGNQYKLKSDVVKRSLDNPQKVNVSEEALNQVKLLDSGEYVVSDMPASTGLPDDYYEKGAHTYDALRNTLGTDFPLESSFSQSIIKQGRANLRNTIETRLTDEALKRIGITRQQALDIIPQD
jgi:hypothetical protein